MISALLPGMTSRNNKSLFEDDFTAALYYDANGVWPAYILKLKLEANIVEAQTIMKSLEPFIKFIQSLFGGSRNSECRRIQRRQG